ncbi:MAG: hypothetical protein IJZ46_03335 [Bacilli bacterium]|nr:hypothetical protein [Bacilli bacterium]
MKETFICSLEKHNIYFLSDTYCGFYISVPYKDYTETNISVRLKSNYQSYDLNKNPIDVVISELINYYKNIDNYNITLILPVFYDDILNRVRTVDDLELYYVLDRYFGNIFNSSYNFLIKNNVKVNSNIFVINNESFSKFTNWFVSRYNNRIEYKTILELLKQSDDFNNYSVVKTPNINFVVGKNEVPALDKTIELETQTFDMFAKEASNDSKSVKPKKESSAGFVSYVLLGVITFVLSLALLFYFVK